MDRTREFLTVAQKHGYVENFATWNKTHPCSDEFTFLALETHQRICTTKEYISSKRRKYLMFSMGSLIMSDKERDAMEGFVVNNLKESLSLLMQLKKLVGVEKDPTDAKESCLRAYRLGVISSLMEWLRNVEEDFSSLRIQRVVNVTAPGDPRVCNQGIKSNSKDSVRSKGDLRHSSSYEYEEPQAHKSQEQKKQLILEGENQSMLLELMETLEQVKSVERKALEIATLNQALSVKLSEQAEEIESLYHDAVYSLNNVKKANKELRRMSEKSFSWNFYWIFCILVATFSLLFLHWIS